MVLKYKPGDEVTIKSRAQLNSVEKTSTHGLGSEMFDFCNTKLIIEECNGDFYKVRGNSWMWEDCMFKNEGPQEELEKADAREGVDDYLLVKKLKKDIKSLKGILGNQKTKIKEYELKEKFTEEFVMKLNTLNNVVANDLNNGYCHEIKRIHMEHGMSEKQSHIIGVQTEIVRTYKHKDL